MKDLQLTADFGIKVSVRNEWRRGVISESRKVRPDHVLLDVGVMRGTPSRFGMDELAMEWNCASLTPARARKIAAALVVAADEAER